MITGVKLEEMLTELEQKQKSVKRELRSCPQGSLMRTKENGGFCYYHDTREGGKRRRYRLNKYPKKAAALARKKYLETEAAFLDNNIEAIQKALAAFCETTPENILQQMPQKYRDLPRDFFFQTDLEQAKALEWSNAPYQQSSYMPERKIHLTSRGLAVRSKSEVIIAEKLYEYDIPFRYEQTIAINGYELAPDFTVLSRKQEEFIWEHCGLTGNVKYMKRHKWKLELYESAGIVPWRNLIITYDNEEGMIDISTVESEIRNKLLI